MHLWGLLLPADAIYSSRRGAAIASVEYRVRSVVIRGEVHVLPPFGWLLNYVFGLMCPIFKNRDQSAAASCPRTHSRTRAQ